jgi:AcrR family transcriptional regulator
MATHRTSSGDPSRTLALLWRSAEGVPAPSGRGPRQSLSVDRIVSAAVEIADADGLDGLTMRRVAEALGVAAMSLYTYVPGKAELLDLMLDSVLAGMPVIEPGGSGWRERVAAIAADNRAVYERHPWLVAVVTSRPALGPGAIGKYERELAALDGLGLDEVEMDASLSFVLGFVATYARGVADAQAVARDSEMSDEQWWAANAPILARVFDPAVYPTAARVGAAAGAAYEAAHSPAHAYEFGLERVLDGLAVLIDARRPR